MHPGWTPPSVGGPVALAFGLSDPSGSTFERSPPRVILARQAVRRPVGSALCDVTDPDGTSVDLFCALS
jgi:hypothetical protein